MFDLTTTFLNGRSQAVRLPKAYQFKGKHIRIRRDPESGDVILSPHRATWEDWEEFFRLAKEGKEEAKDFLIDRGQSPVRERDLF